MTTYRSILIALAAASASAGSAHALITGFTGGMIQQISPPAYVAPGTSYASSIDTVTVWDEQQGVFASSLAMDMVNNPGASSGATPGSVSGLVDSHFLQYRHTTLFAPATGTVTFSGKILGVAFDGATLDPSDVLGPGGTTYQQGLYRGMSAAFGDAFSINNDTLTFSLWGDPGYLDTVQLRIVTEVPAPGSLALLGVAGLAAARRNRA